ncbi:unnamed protein product [Acanthoscelides obtectus]|uniref:Uncharacterized protein n=1 Tax=Acanthoscelides obtectus TaxID=200917 RepID=A0A9P0KCN1_ACAOB|nr:unnamed protein product [Acanthoscelides obtectus]CAK1680023.1 hypothetical protein AOBTE_LOCUS32494 [Acanthoscelides obtectus]
MLDDFNLTYPFTGFVYFGSKIGEIYLFCQPLGLQGFYQFYYQRLGGVFVC